MKVRQLINILQEDDLDAEVRIAIDEDCNATYPIMNLLLNNESKEVILIPNEFNEN